MNTERAYRKMQEANRIIEEVPGRKYALYAILFLAEIAACFAVIYFFGS